MPNTTTSLAARRLSPRRETIRAKVRDLRRARANRRTLERDLATYVLERDLATYVSDSDLNDLTAMFDRYDPAETAQIRQILAAQRRSALLTGK